MVKLSMEDMTYYEIKLIKRDIKSFSNELIKYGNKQNKHLNVKDTSFFNFISKRIVFLKFLYRGEYSNKKKYFYKVLISDYYNLIISLIKSEVRYIYVNERSLIENYTRLLTSTTIEEDRVTGKIINSLKSKEYLFKLTEDDFSLIKSEYSISSGYIHGGLILDKSLLYIFEEFTKNKWTLRETNDYYERVQKMIKTFDKMMVSEFHEFINSCFHRRKSVLEYLLGNETLELLFL